MNRDLDPSVGTLSIQPINHGCMVYMRDQLYCLPSRLGKETKSQSVVFLVI